MSNDALWRIESWFAELSPSVRGLLRDYHTELLKFNPRINLISRASEAESDEVHVADAILAARHISFDARATPVHDLGSGNGIPGLVFAILRPDLPVRLVESDSRKVEFMKHVIHTLRLPNASTMCTRVEALERASIDRAVNRGFASIDRCLNLIGAAGSPGATIYHLKGSGWRTEIEAVTADQRARWASDVVGEYRLPVSGAERAIVRSRAK